jgi:hypothetical protein
MPRKLVVLDHLTVKEPCRAEWREMQGNDEVRFCDHCAKNVHNLSAMTRADALRLVEESRGGLCIRLEKTSTGSVFTRDDHVFSFPKLRLSPLAAAAFGIAITVTPAFAQETTQPATPKPTFAQTRAAKAVEDGTSIVHGRLTSPNRNSSVEDLRVTLIRGSFRRETRTNYDGLFRFEGISPGNYILTVSDGQTVNPFTLSDIGVGANEIISLTAQLPLEISGPPLVGLPDSGTPGSPLDLDALFSIPSIKGHKRTFQNSPFFDAASTGDLGKLRKLFKKLKSADVLSPEKETPLIYAVRARKVEAVGFLLENKADPNARSLTGRTALMLAVMYGDAEIVRLLLKHGADRTLTDHEGRKTREYATSQEIADLLDTPKTK